MVSLTWLLCVILDCFTFLTLSSCVPHPHLDSQLQCHCYHLGYTVFLSGTGVHRRLSSIIALVCIHTLFILVLISTHCYIISLGYKIWCKTPSIELKILTSRVISSSSRRLMITIRERRIIHNLWSWKIGLRRIATSGGCNELGMWGVRIEGGKRKGEGVKERIEN